MRAFLKAIQIYMKAFFQYRWGFLLSFFIHPVILLINIFLFKTVYAHSDSASINGYDLTQMVWYFACVNFVWVFIWNFTDSQISDRIISGEMTISFLRPMSLFKLELADAIALRIIGVLLEFTMDMVVFSLIYKPTFMTTASFIRFLVLVIGAFFLFFIINYLIGMCAFFIKSTRSLTSVKFIFFASLGGAYIPLEFFPSGLATAIDYMPFKYIFYEPIQFFLNRKSGSSEFMFATAMQWCWIFLLLGVYRISWSAAAKRFCAVGG